MLNYIWAGLIILSFVFALIVDISELREDRYRNGEELPVSLSVSPDSPTGSRRLDVQVTIDPSTYRAFFGVDEAPSAPFEGFLIQSTDGNEIRFALDAPLPEPLHTIRDFTAKRDLELLAMIPRLPAIQSDSAVSAAILFRPVRFVRLNAIAEAAIEFAETAVTIVLGLIGILALWLGLLRIAQTAGLIDSFVKLVQPLLRPLFPEIPRDHPALGMIALNLTANAMGLGNAATPLGMKAMEELQELNPEKDTATNEMVTLLALNTGSVQLVPPTVLVAVMGLQINQLIFAIIIATAISTTFGVVAAKILQRLPRYKKTNPVLHAQSTDSVD